MTLEHLEKINICRHLLPEPAPAVVGELIEEIKKLHEIREQYNLLIKNKSLSLESDSVIGSCECLCKTPDAKHHKLGCKYRLITELNEARQAFVIAIDQLAQAQSELRRETEQKKNLFYALELIEEAFVDGDDTYKAWLEMGRIAKNALEQHQSENK